MNQRAFEAIVREAIVRWQGHPTWAWAGECGVFADHVWCAAKEAGADVPLDSFDSKLNCDSPLESLPGITFEELEQLQVPRGLNHVWLVWGARHYDAAHPEGVACPWYLRCVRQALVEMLQLCAPERLRQLCVEHPYWAESARLAKEFAALSQEREAQYAEN